VEIIDLDEVIDDLRRELALESQELGLVNLAQAISESCDEEEVMAAAELDLLERGLLPHEASMGVSAGVLAYKFSSALRGISYLQPEGKP
jgi:hypothetical protein